MVKNGAGVVRMSFSCLDYMGRRKRGKKAVESMENLEAYHKWGKKYFEALESNELHKIMEGIVSEKQKLTKL